jgi:hypothetical protein
MSSRSSVTCGSQSRVVTEQHLTLAFEHGFRCGEKPVTADVIETVLARQLDDLESRLARHGYSVKNLADQFHAKLAEVRPFLRGALDPERPRDLSEQMRVAGLPLSPVSFNLSRLAICRLQDDVLHAKMSFHVVDCCTALRSTAGLRPR